jgi:hypothetical protein
LSFQFRFNHNPDFFCAQERPPDIWIIRTKFERDEPVTVRAVRLEIGPDLLSTLPKYLGTLCAFDSDLIVDHEMPRKGKSSPADLKGLITRSHKKAATRPPVGSRRSGAARLVVIMSTPR